MEKNNGVRFNYKTMGSGSITIVNLHLPKNNGKQWGQVQLPSSIKTMGSETMGSGSITIVNLHLPCNITIEPDPISLRQFAFAV
jgi:hypothetical protein